MKNTDDIRIYNYVIARNPNYEYLELKKYLKFNRKIIRIFQLHLRGWDYI